MSDRKNRFNLFKKDFSTPKVFSNLKSLGKSNKIKSDDEKNKMADGENSDPSSFASFDSIIPESSPLKKNSGSDSGFYNDELVNNRGNANNGIYANNVGNANNGIYANNKPNSHFDDLEGVDEKYARYIYSEDSNFEKDLDSNENYLIDSERFKDSKDFINSNESNYSNDFKNSNEFNNSNKKVKIDLLNLKKRLLNKNDSSKSLFGKITFLLIFLVLISSIFYFFVYQPFQNELNLERNSKLNELNALYKGPLEINENYYTLENRINQAANLEELKSIDILRSATKDWRIYHSSKIVSCKDEFGRVMMSYGDNKNIIMSVRDANDFVKDNDARILSNVQFEKVNTVIVPISISRLQATAGLISVGSVVDIYSLSDNSSGYDYDDDLNNQGLEDEKSDNEGLENSKIPINESTDNNLGSPEDENLETDSGASGGSLGTDYDGYDDSLETVDGGPLVSGATVLAILRSKDSGLVDSTVSRSNTIIKGNETKPFENTSAFSSDVEELLKEAVLNSNSNDNALDSYLTSYGVRLSNFERISNLGDLDSNYLLLLEVPQSDVNFVINNMDNLILTIPTDFAPNWVLTELNETYYENLYQNQSLDFI